LPHVFRRPGSASIARSREIDRLVVASATFRDIDTEAREALASALEECANGMGERVLLHTCHRVELILFVEPGANLAKLHGGLKRCSGSAAAERVMLVAAGLDSAVLAEEQVLGQVRDAYASALARGQTGPITNELLRRSVRFGKRVRSFAQPIGDRSLVDHAARWVEDRVSSPPRRSVSALVFGTGEVGRTLAGRFAARGASVTVASRSRERAATVAAELPHLERHGTALISDALAGQLDYDIVALAVQGGVARLDTRHLVGRRPLVVDLSSPCTVTPEAAALLGDRLLNLDRLGIPGARRLSADVEHRLRSEARAEASAFAAWVEFRASGDGIALLRGHAEEIRRRHLDRLRHKGKFDQAQAAALEAMTVAMFGELLHVPTVRLGRDAEAAARVREVFGIE
jgi:glutamyl-tRNA reductase